MKEEAGPEDKCLESLERGPKRVCWVLRSSEVSELLKTSTQLPQVRPIYA